MNKAEKKSATQKGVAGNSKGISDFNKDIPCKVKVTGKYRNSGNVFLGFEKGHHQPWRFGKHIFQLNPETILEIEGKATYFLRTERVLAYIQNNKENISIYRGKGFGGMPNASYKVSIKELVDYCQDGITIRKVA